MPEDESRERLKRLGIDLPESPECGILLSVSYDSGRGIAYVETSMRICVLYRGARARRNRLDELVWPSD